MIVKSQYVKKVKAEGFRFSQQGLDMLERVVEKMLERAIEKARKTKDITVRPEHFG